MEKIFRLFKKSGILPTLLLFLFLTLAGQKLWSQSTTKTDSICLCGQKAEIDSALKILADYPDLKTQARLFEKLYADSKALTEIEQLQILKVLNLKVWDVKKIKQCIRRHKFRKWTWGTGGMIIGIVIAITTTI